MENFHYQSIYNLPLHLDEVQITEGPLMILHIGCTINQYQQVEFIYNINFHNFTVQWIFVKQIETVETYHTYGTRSETKMKTKWLVVVPL